MPFWRGPILVMLCAVLLTGSAARVPYLRYLKQGAYVSWAAHFGIDCPEPDFNAAARFPREQALRDARHIASRFRWPIGGGMVVVLGAGIWLFWRRRAHRLSAMH